MDRPVTYDAVVVGGIADGKRVPCIAVFCEPGADAGSPLVASLGCELRDDGCIVTDHPRSGIP